MGIFSSLFGIEPDTVVKEYRCNGDYFKIEFRKQSNGTWKLHCLSHPRNPRSTDVTDCHLYRSGEICVAAGHEPRSLDKAQAIAIFWARGYSNFVRTGQFYNGKAKVNV